MSDLNEKLSGLKSIINRAQEYCAYQERCEFEVRQKLQTWGVDPERSHKIIVQLEKDNFLNDLRFAETFVRSKFRLKKWGKNKIAYELRSKKIPAQIISNCLQTIDEHEYLATIHFLIAKKTKELKEKDIYTKKQKIARFLSSRGYESALVFEVLKISEI